MDVLIVDDKEANRKLLCAYLATHGFNMYEADNGERAIELFRQHQPDIVLMDIMMPGMDGYDTTTAIKRYSPDIYTPVIYVTALHPEEAMKKAIDAGGDDFVTKPVNFEILISKIHAHLRIKDAYEKLAVANEELKRHNQRITREHEIVEHIFNNALNNSFIDSRFIRYHMTSVSAFNGDILLVDKKPDGKMCVLVGDFTGHGLSAAIGSLPVVKVFFTMVKKNLDLTSIVSELNETIKMLLPPDMFLCASLIELDGVSKQAWIWSGGLPPAMQVNPHTNELKRLPGAHMPLGVLPNDQLETDMLQLSLAQGEKLYLYTDGVTEARNRQGEMYGVDRLESLLTGSENDIFERVIDDHRRHSGGTEQSDDVTLVELSCDILPLDQV